MKYVAKHGLSDLSRVRTVIDKAYEAYAEKLSDFSPKLDWKNDKQALVSFTVMARTIQAQFDIDDEDVRISGDVPFLFRPFQSRIEKVLGEEIEKWLAKARAGEL